MEENKYLAQLKELTLNLLKEERVKVILFGSRARKDNNIGSDVDIGLLPYREIDKRKILLLKEKIEDLNIPYKVEIVNFSETSEEFRKEAMRDAVIWKG